MQMPQPLPRPTESTPWGTGPAGPLAHRQAQELPRKTVSAQHKHSGFKESIQDEFISAWHLALYFYTYCYYSTTAKLQY